MKQRRKKIWIDGFQTRLSLRIAIYFALYQIAVWALVIIERHLSFSLPTILGDAGLSALVFLTVCVAFLGFSFMYDAVCYCHRIVGPLYRFRKTIQAITAGEELDLVTLRKGDFLQEMKDELNEMLKVLEERGAVSLCGLREKVTQ